MKSPEKHPVNQKSPEKGKARNGDSSQMGDSVSSRSQLRRFAELFPQFFDEIKNSEKCKELKVGSQSKQPNSQAIARDRISELPDALVCHILSFLSTKDYVRTSILSSRWRKIWASVPNLDFDRRDIDDPVGFLSIVDRVLSFRSAAPIHKFRVHCYVTDFSVIDRWIRTAVGCHVVEFDLYVGSILNQAVEFPESLFLCRTLVVLKLNSYGLRFNPPQSGCFLSLKFFHFTACHPDNESMEKLFSCCPVLEDLTIDGVTGPDVLNFKISAPELKKLRISLRAGDFEGDPNNFYIKAPKLEKLDVAEDVLSNYTMESANSLVEAIVNLYHHETGLQLNFSILSTGLLQGISNVTYLSLSAHLLEVWYLPAAFDNLRKLELVLRSCHNCKFLAELLMKSSNLEDLVLEYNEDVCTTYSEGEEDEEPEAYGERGCYPPETVPICFSSHLKSITIRGFRGDDDEMLLAQYFIENGEVLNKVTIYTGALLMKRGDIYKEFATFRRGSRTCRVELL